MNFSEGNIASVCLSVRLSVNSFLLSHLKDHWSDFFLNLIRMFPSMSSCASTEKNLICRQIWPPSAILVYLCYRISSETTEQFWADLNETYVRLNVWFFKHRNNLVCWQICHLVLGSDFMKFPIDRLLSHLLKDHWADLFLKLGPLVAQVTKEIPVRRQIWQSSAI